MQKRGRSFFAEGQLVAPCVLTKPLEICKPLDAQVGGIPELGWEFLKLPNPGECKFEEAGV